MSLSSNLTLLFLHLSNASFKLSSVYLNDPSGYKGKVNCPDYNSVCTSNIWCNDPLDCIEKKIEADKSSYSYSYQLRGVEGNNAIYTGRLSLFSIAILMISLLFFI